jgi:hypothetical protein
MPEQVVPSLKVLKEIVVIRPPFLMQLQSVDGRTADGCVGMVSGLCAYIFPVCHLHHYVTYNSAMTRLDIAPKVDPIEYVLCLLSAEALWPHLRFAPRRKQRRRFVYWK